MQTLAGYLEASASRVPDHVAVVDPDGSSLTYRELNDRADRVAAFLVAKGVAPGDRVGLLLPKSVTAVTAVFGILKARAAYVPADYTAPLERNRVILTDCNVKAVFLDRRCVDVLTDGAGSLRPDLVVLVDPPGRLSATRGTPGAASWSDAVDYDAELTKNGAVRTEDLAYILYTSGSTGVPKGVMLTHENATSFVDWCSSVFDPNETDRFSSHAPFHFDLSVLDIYVAVKHGGALFLIAEDLGKSPKDLARFIRDNRLTIWYSTPSILSLLAQFGGIGGAGFDAVRLVLFAGEVFPVKHLRQVAICWPQAAYYNLYGPTETNVCTFARIPVPVPRDRTEPYPIGWPCSHCHALVLDENRAVEPGGEGLLYIAGPSVFQGYWNRPIENAKAFVDRDGVRWYNTGDVVREDAGDGFIYLGRRDRMVKRRGYRIELGEIERALYQHPQIREAAVISVSDEASGGRILAYLVPHPQQRPSIIELKTFCARQLPAYMSPDVFQFLDALPRTSTNKVDYQGLLRSVATTA